MLRIAARRCARPEEVHHLVAAVWLAVIRAAPRFDPTRGPAFPWILGVAANLVADQRRRLAREREALHRLAGRRVLDDGNVARLEEAIDASQAAHEVLAELVPSREGSVRPLLTRARRKLRPSASAASAGARS